jgi:hypothetical protein
MKQKSALFRLPYWQKLPVCHILDVMHIEKNITENVIKHLTGEKDTVASCCDMEQANVMKDLWLSREPGINLNKKPHAPYVFTDAERVKFMRQVCGTLTPLGYSATLTKHLGEEKLSQLKSHDYHLFLQQLLPACIRNYLDPGPRKTIIRLGHVFQRICAKVIDPSTLDDL